MAICICNHLVRYAKCLHRPIVDINKKYTKDEIHFISILYWILYAYNSENTDNCVSVMKNSLLIEYIECLNPYTLAICI